MRLPLFLQYCALWLQACLAFPESELEVRRLQQHSMAVEWSLLPHVLVKTGLEVPICLQSR